MGSNLLQYPGKDSGEYPPRHELGYYDVERAVDRRQRWHQAGLAWQHQIDAIRNWLAGLEKRLFHGPAAHAHPKLAAVHRPHHR